MKSNFLKSKIINIQSDGSLNISLECNHNIIFKKSPFNIIDYKKGKKMKFGINSIKSHTFSNYEQKYFK